MKHTQYTITGNSLSDWERFYAAKSMDVEWLVDIRLILPFLDVYLPSHDAEILDLCCGSSKLAEGLLANGYSHITLVDWCQGLAASMRVLLANAGAHTEFLCSDARCVELPDTTFGCVIVKGTLECYLGFDDLVGAIKIVHEAYRLLKRGGALLVISQLPLDTLTFLLTDKSLLWHSCDHKALPCGVLEGNMCLLSGNVSAYAMVAVKA